MPKTTERQTRIVIITQDDVFFLPDALDYLLRRIGCNFEVVACVLFSVSPFGKRETFFHKSLKTYRIFGIKFFVYVSFKYVFAKFFRRSVRQVMAFHNIPIVELIENINSEKSLSVIKNLQPDILLSIAGNQIFKTALINSATLGTLNLHTALLPKYRGLMPSFWVLLNREQYTGVSVFIVDEGIDSGTILVQKKIAINGMTQWDLIKATKWLGMEAIVEAVDILRTGISDRIPNPKEESTYYKFPTHSDVQQFHAVGAKFF